jgi:predicted MPP superfamily phosphohydrolase
MFSGHRYYLGLDKCKNMFVYVSAGTGSWGPPVRLGTRPEVTKITLTKKLETSGNSDL